MFVPLFAAGGCLGPRSLKYRGTLILFTDGVTPLSLSHADFSIGFTAT